MGCKRRWRARVGRERYESMKLSGKLKWLVVRIGTWSTRCGVPFGREFK